MSVQEFLELFVENPQVEIFSMADEDIIFSGHVRNMGNYLLEAELASVDVPSRAGWVTINID